MKEWSFGISIFNQNSINGHVCLETGYMPALNKPVLILKNKQIKLDGSAPLLNEAVIGLNSIFPFYVYLHQGFVEFTVVAAFFEGFKILAQALPRYSERIEMEARAQLPHNRRAPLPYEKNTPG